MDLIDVTILDTLQKDARVPMTDIAKSVGLSGPSVAMRIKKLEEKQIIRRYVTLLNHERLNRRITAFIAVTLNKPVHAKAFIASVHRIDEVMECFHVTGEMDYLLKVRTSSPATLEHIIMDQIRSLEGVVQTKTNVILSTCKDETYLGVTPKDVAV